MSLALTLTALLALPQIDARSPQLIASPSLQGAPLTASAADLSVIIDRDPVGQDLRLRASDGRGTSWSAPLPFTPLGGPFSTYADVAIAGERAYVAWADDRFEVPVVGAAYTPFLRAFDASTQSFGAEVQLAIPTAPSLVQIEDLVVLADARPTGDHVHVVTLEVETTSSLGDAVRHVAVNTSHDGGATWLPRTVLTTLPDQFPDKDIWKLRAFVHGDTVDVFWDLDAPFTLPPLSFSILHRRSVDAGATFGALTTLPPVTVHATWDVDVEGDVFALATNPYASPFFPSLAEVRISSDVGATWSAPRQLNGLPASPLTASSSAEVVVHPGSGDVLVVYGAGAPGTTTDGVYRAHSPDAGATWSPELMLAGPGSSAPSVRVASNGRQTATTAWLEVASLGAASSNDSGASFTAVGPLFTPSTWQSYAATWNDRYQNFIVTLQEPAPTFATFVSGFRPADIDLTGFTGGSTSLNIDFANMTGGADLALFVVSSAEGALALPAPDGRITGLGASPLLSSSIGLVGSGVFLAPITNGAGTTGPIPTLPLQPGLTAYGLGLSIDLGTGAFVDLTDVMRIDT